MRELNEYEKSKFLDDLGRFNAPEFVGYGDESGEYYDSFVEAEKAAGYLHKEQQDELQPMLQAVILDYYYENLAGIYQEGWREPDEEGLPSFELVLEKQKEFQDTDHPAKRALDWAMEWRTENRGRIATANQIKRLREELQRLETDG